MGRHWGPGQTVTQLDYSDLFTLVRWVDTDAKIHVRLSGGQLREVVDWDLDADGDLVLELG